MSGFASPSGLRSLAVAALLLVGATAAGAARSERDAVIVVSDLHLGEGAHSPLEDFKVDVAFSDFVDHLLAEAATSSGTPLARALTGLERGFDRAVTVLGNGNPGRLRPVTRAAEWTARTLGQLAGKGRLTVVFNGDCFDFVKVVTPPDGESFPDSGPMTTSERDVSPTEAVAVLKMRRILQAHPVVFDALARLLAAGHSLVFLPGNHDQELAYGKVRRALREHLRARAGRASGSIRYNPQFHLQDGVQVEHGHRYETVNTVDHIAWPFKGEGAARQLRPAASSFLVAEFGNPLRQKLPHITQLSRGMAQVAETVRRAPEYLPALALLIGRLGLRVGHEAPEEEARATRRHLRLLRSQLRLNDLQRQVNATRAEHGDAPIDERELLQLLREWDGKASQPFLRGSPPLVGRLRANVRAALDAFKVVRPLYLREWANPEGKSRLREGQNLVLRHNLADVVITGHTHVCSLEATCDGKHIANSGTWTPILVEGGTRAEPTAHLTFVEVRPRATALRRWDAASKRPVTLQAKRRARR